MQKFKEPKAEVEWQLMLVLTRSSATCRREAARCSVSLKILLSLKVSHSNVHLWIWH